MTQLYDSGQFPLRSYRIGPSLLHKRNLENPLAETYVSEMRRMGQLGTDLYKAALIRAGHLPKPLPLPQIIKAPPPPTIKIPEPIIIVGIQGERLLEVGRKVAHKHNLCVKDLRGPSRLHHIVKARNECFAICRTLHPKLSTTAIGNFYGGRDHTTVLYGCRRHNGMSVRKAKGAQ